MKILHLTLKAKYWDMIASGEKLEEYREIKPFWIKRFVNGYTKGFCQAIPELDEFIRQMEIPCETSVGNTVFDALKINWDAVCFARGGHFHKSIPQMTVELKDIKIGEGKAKWGAVEDEKYFVIQLGKILETT